VSSRIRRRWTARCVSRYSSEHQRQHDLHEQVGLEVRLGRDGLGEPLLDLDLPGLGDHVALAVRTRSGLGFPGEAFPSLARRARVAYTWPKGSGLPLLK
jgi:hypothetical protein